VKGGVVAVRWRDDGGGGERGSAVWDLASLYRHGNGNEDEAKELVRSGSPRRSLQGNIVAIDGRNY
jgi:hypothetical protein